LKTSQVFKRLSVGFHLTQSGEKASNGACLAMDID
jgi:hypothetical protein